MQFQFIYWILSLFTRKQTPETNFISNFVDGNSESFGLMSKSQFPISRAEKAEILSKGLGNSSKALIDLERFWSEKRPGSNPRFWAVVDMTQHSSKKRLYIFDFNEMKTITYLCAHGKNSDPQNNGYATKFSNIANSNCSSKGIYKCSETYISGKFGYAMRLDGLQSTNSNARDRAIVFHGSNYVSDAYNKKNGKIGRSLGCTAVDFKHSKALIDLLKNGSPLSIWS